MAQTDIAVFAMEHNILKENTLRLIRIGYPLLRVRANILSYKDNQEFCLIKKFIHRLVTGDRPNDENPTVYVQDRLQAFQLLGLDGDLYDVSSYYYDELILDGLIHDSPRGALAGAAPVNDPALERIRSSRQTETYLTVDTFNLDIYGQKISGLPCKSTEDLINAYEKDICIPFLPEYVEQPEVLEALINQKNFDFDSCTEEYKTDRLQAQNMPLGVQGIELIREDEDDASVDVFWMPYYLAWEKTEDGTQYCLYSNTSGRPINLFPINKPEHKALQEFLQQIFRSQYYGGVSYFLTDCVEIPLTSGKNKPLKGVTVDPDGNYSTALTDTQLALICMSEEAEAIDVLNLITKGTGVIPTREAGRLVRFHLTEKQRAFCQQVLEDPQNRYALAMPMLEQAVEQSDTEAAYHLANCVLMGRGTEQDMEKALSLYHKAAENNHPWAKLYEGLCYLSGHGAEVDPDAAIACWKELDPRAPSYSAALHNIGTAYIRQEKYDDAAAVLQQAEQRNFVSAFTAYSLGYLYEKGLGVEQSFEEAAKRYEIAAKWGHIPARVSLAACYLRGAGVKKDISYGKQLLKEALRPCPEERLFFLGSKPFIPYLNLACTDEELEKRRATLETLQQRAKDLLSKL